MKLFCYGTLNVDAIQHAVWGETKHGAPATLNDYRLGFNEHGYFEISKEYGECTVGKVYDLTKEQADKTDVYENNLYDLKRVTKFDNEAVYAYVRKENNA